MIPERANNLGTVHFCLLPKHNPEGPRWQEKGGIVFCRNTLLPE